MSEYTASIASALGMLTRKGQPVTITRYTPGAYDTATGKVPTPLPDDEEIGQGVALNYRSNEIDGTSIIRGDVKLILSAVGISEPQIKSKVSFTGFTGRVLSVDKISPAGEPIIYKVQVRK